MEGIKEFKITKKEASALKSMNEMVENRTSLPFLMEHSGLRNGKLHTILSSTGAGKTTLVRTILIDYLQNNSGNVLLWLSEESYDDFRTSASYMDEHENLTGRISIYSEVDQLNSEAGSLIRKMPNRHNYFLTVLLNKTKENFGLIIFDNITTSNLYTDNIVHQQSMAYEIKAVASQAPCPMLIVAHTAKNEKIKKLIFDSDSIKGSSKITQMSEYIYCLQTILRDEERYSFLIIEKSRNHSIKNNLYLLSYDTKQKIYTKHIPYELNKFQELAKGKYGIRPV